MADLLSDESSQLDPYDGTRFDGASARAAGTPYASQPVEDEAVVDDSNIVLTEEQTKFVATREVERERCAALLPEHLEDGETVRNVWVLVQLNHWALEQERMIVLTNTSLLRVKVNFFEAKVLKVARTRLTDIRRIDIGRARYPEGSLTEKMLPSTSSSNLTGRLAVRIYTSLEEPTWQAQWNPFSNKVPFQTFRSHVGLEPNMGNREVAHFGKRLIGATRDENESVQVNEQADIVIDSKCGVHAVLFNEANLGCNKTRGALAF